MIISNCLDSVSVTSATDLFGVSRCGYYKWLKSRNKSLTDDSDISLREQIQNIAIEFPGYGYRRITAELQKHDYLVNHKKVLRLMREDNLLCMKKRFGIKTTDSKHDEKIYLNLAKDLQVTGINQMWVADITYIQLLNEFVYLAVVIDVFSRRCIGWEISRHINTKLTINALYKAIKTRGKYHLKGLVHHSDQGVQYASYEYVECLKEYGIQIIMSRKGNPYDNAFAESFIKTLKCEEVYLNEYRTLNDVIENIEHFIEEVYNLKRLHSSIGYKSPIEFEEELNLLKKLN